MMLQFEVTTRCNFDCYYCAGRLMRQGDMPFAMFSELLQRHISAHGAPQTVSLQGEGEPTLHDDFFRMAELVHTVGAKPYTITNGTCKHPERFVGLFPRVGISVDTLDDTAGCKIGRYNLPRVLSFIEALAPHTSIVIHTVASKDHTPRVAQWCKQKGYTHVIQPLQTKPDYSRRYRPDSQQPSGTQGRFSCSYLAEARMRYFSLDGLEMPCCFIKDTSQYEGMKAMEDHQRSGSWPSCCVGCRYAMSHRRIAKLGPGVTQVSAQKNDRAL